MKICQYLILIIQILGFFWSLNADFNGRPAREPYGFDGAIATIVISVAIFFLYWGAGAFSTLLP